ncbi:MAG: hypothetical protein GY953_18500, partial [bacterium]|nr:hypothetical protein [bacterium]
HPGTSGFHYFTGGTFASWRFLYSVNPRAVNRHIEQQWNTTIDSPAKWRRLEWGLHPQYLRPYANPWKHLDEIKVDVEVPFATEHKMYPQIALELLYAARMYSEHPGNDPRSWQIGSILLKRFEDARDPRTDLSPPMFAYAVEPNRKRWFGESVRESIGIPFFAKLAELARDTDDGGRILDFSLRELRAHHQHKEGPMEDGVFWAFALMYRLTDDDDMWNAVREIAMARGYGDIGSPGGAGVALRFDAEFDTRIRPEAKRNTTAGFIVHAFVELYRKTAARPYLEFAAKAADAIVAETYVNGLFARARNAKWARTASMTPMALLHLEAAIQGVELDPESVFCRRWVYRFTRNRDRQPGDNGHDWAIYTATIEEGKHE